VRMRAGFALPAVLAVVVLVVPLVFTFALRSRAALDWYVKLEDQKKAILLAEEGEAAARAVLRAGTAATAGDRRTPTSAMEWRILDLTAGDAGQRRVALVGEGVSGGEEKLLIAFGEVFAGPPNLLLETDRGWVPPGPATVTLPQLVDQHRQRVGAYLTQLAREANTTESEFLSRMREQGGMLPCPDIERDWAAISTALARAKCRP
jgi:hypothetical protein